MFGGYLYSQEAKQRSQVSSQLPISTSCLGVFELVEQSSFWGPTQDEPYTELGSPQGPSIEY